MKRISALIFAVTCTALQGYVQIQIPDEEVAEACRMELERILSKEPQKHRFGFFFNDDEDPEDPFLTPTEQPHYCLDNITEFKEIPLHDWERQIITFIVTEMAEKNVFQLLLQKSEMEKKGRKIDHVHPLRFIGHICEDPKLKKALRVVRKNPFKWENFISGFARRVVEETGKNNLFRFLPSFCKHVEADEAKVTSYLKAGDSDGLVHYLISN